MIFEVVKLQSKTIEYVGYDQVSKILQVTTKQGTTYYHRKIPLEIYKGIKDADSPGTFYTEQIKNKYFQLNAF